MEANKITTRRLSTARKEEKHVEGTAAARALGELLRRVQDGQYTDALAVATRAAYRGREA